MIRTSLSLIGFGFIVFQFFQHLHQNSPGSSSNGYIKIFTIVIVALGVIMLAMGIIYPVKFMVQIRSERNSFKDEGLLPTIDTYPLSMTLIVAVLLFLLGITAIIIMVLQ